MANNDNGILANNNFCQYEVNFLECIKLIHTFCIIALVFSIFNLLLVITRRILFEKLNKNKLIWNINYIISIVVLSICFLSNSAIVVIYTYQYNSYYSESGFVTKVTSYMSKSNDKENKLRDVIQFDESFISGILFFSISLAFFGILLFFTIFECAKFYYIYFKYLSKVDNTIKERYLLSAINGDESD